MIYRTVEVEVGLDEFDTDDLVEELKSREIDVVNCDIREWLTRIYEKRKLGFDYQQELDDLIWQVIGRVS